MKRFKMINEYGQPLSGSGIRPEESDDGEWVRFEDVDILLGKIRGLENKIDKIEDYCNCEENWKMERVWNWTEKKEYDHEWICPAHGYKKL